MGFDTSSKNPPKGAPDLKAAEAAFAEFCATVAALRAPDGGCPWDLKQDHRTLRRFMIEEAYEAADAMIGADPRALCEELGDVLLQVVLNAQVALDQKNFSIVEVIEGINAKMRRRHPHVFGSPEVRQNLTPEQVRGNWEEIKAAEKRAQPEKKPAGVFAEAEAKTPATLQALAIGKIAAKIRFDWDRPDEVLEQVRSEVDEVAQAMQSGADATKIAEEIGDVYFSLAQLCRHVGADPEVVSVDANRKFLRRFAALEAQAAARNIDVATASREQLENLWLAVKADEKA